jgi:hypothetical protein
MSDSDKWFFGFITLWIVLCSGTPDLLDGITSSLMKDSCYVEAKK